MKLFRMSKEYKKAASNKKNALIQREKNKYGKCERADTKVKKEMLSEKDILTAGVKNGGYDLGADTVIGIKSADSIGPREVRATRPSKMRYDISDEDDRAIWSDKGKLVSDIDMSATVKKQRKRKSVAACNFHKMEIDIPTGLNGYESDLTESTMGMTEYNSSSSDEESVQGEEAAEAEAAASLDATDEDDDAAKDARPIELPVAFEYTTIRSIGPAMPSKIGIATAATVLNKVGAHKSSHNMDVVSFRDNRFEVTTRGMKTTVAVSDLKGGCCNA